MKKPLNCKQVVSAAFIILILAVFLSAFGYGAANKLGFIAAKSTNDLFEKSTTDLYGNALSVYDRDTTASAAAGEEDSLTDRSGILGFLENNYKWFTELVESKYTERYFAKTPFTLTKRRFDKTMGLNLTTSLIGTQNDTQLWSDTLLENDAHDLIYNMDDTDIREPIDRVTAFGRKVLDQGRNFLYFIAPEKPEQTAEWYRGVYQSRLTEKEQELERALDEQDIPYISYREYAEANGKYSADLFYHTDHHWRAQTALDADRLLCETLNERFGFSADLTTFDLSNYRTDYMDKPFLGQQGTKVSTVYVKPEKFPILTPEYSTDVDVFVSEVGKARGRVEDVLMDRSALDFSMFNLLEAIPHSYYGYGCRALIQIRNNESRDGRRVLMIVSSFACPMYPFLTSAAEQIDVIDPRVFTGSIEKYMEITQPDTVILLCGIGLYAHQGGNDEVTSFFNFE